MMRPNSKFNREPSAIEDTAAQWIARRDAGLSPAEELEFEQWIAMDLLHQYAWQRADAAWQALDRPFATGATQEFLQSITARRKLRRRRRMAGLAAALLLSLGAAVVYQQGIPPSVTERRSEAGAVVHRAASQVLPDGSLVESRPGTVFRVEFTPRIRRIVLNAGEAHFQVLKDPARPFIVDAGALSVKAIGTAFLVQRDRTAVEVVVTEGVVAVEQSQDAVRPPNASAAASTAPLPPPAEIGAGNRVSVDLARAALEPPAVLPVPTAEMNQRLAWRAPRLEFTGTPLAEAIALLNEHGAAGRNIRFVIGDPKIAGVRIGGLFRADNTDAFVQLLQTGFGITAEPNGETELILRKTR